MHLKSQYQHEDKANVFPILLYGGSRWKVRATVTRKLQAFINAYLNCIIELLWPKIMWNEELYHSTGQMTLEVRIIKYMAQNSGGRMQVSRKIIVEAEAHCEKL